MKRYFEFDKHGTSYKQEFVAGITTFITMSYILVLNPAILSAAGIPKGPSLVATILSAMFGTFIMAFYAKRPFAIAPYMGENAFIAYTVVQLLGHSWQTAIGAIFISGVLFVILTISKLRVKLVESIPKSLKFSFAAGIGLFLIFIGLNESGIVVPDSPVKLGAIRSGEVLLSILGLLVMSFMLIMKVKGAMLFGIFGVSVLAFIFGVSETPDQIVSMPPSLMPILFKLDILGALNWGFISVILTVLVMDFVDTMATLIGVSAQAGYLDKEGNLPYIERPMMADSTATVFASLVGTTTTGTFIESAAGIHAGGRTGFTAFVVAIFFGLALFFSPILTAIPALAYGPVLILVGFVMMSSIAKIDFDDFTESIPALSVVTLMSFTYNIGIGMTAGFILYVLCKIAGKRTGELNFGLWVLFALSLAFYIFYPYE